jgi:hypothetical protein
MALVHGPFEVFDVMAAGIQRMPDIVITPDWRGLSTVYVEAQMG